QASKWEFRVADFGAGLVGQGDTPQVALTDWQEQIHIVFQRLYRKLPFEMTDQERAQWEILERLIDIQASIDRSPIVLRQVGQLLSSRPGPYKIQWIDNRVEEVNLASMPPEFAHFMVGQWFEAVVKRDRTTFSMHKVVAIKPIQPVEPLSGKDLTEFWDSLPTT